MRTISALALALLLASFTSPVFAQPVHFWSRGFGNANSDFAFSVTLDNSGNIVLTGSFLGTVNYGGTDLVSAGGTDIFIAKYNANAVHQWSKRVGGNTGTDAGNAVAVDASGNVVVVGYFMGTGNFGGTNLVSAGSSDIFIARYNASGAHQ